MIINEEILGGKCLTYCRGG